ncbi:hypothetical protein [Mariniblastus fucicola]|uniref:Mov34/MPN/PAD-1 family protein n=1 Tax=Mariniblastus fucicola TaxID=980251 RepID=A0A5B9PQ96_9BACT|nr:hypothetical protein [Mariniblastus fucicola]QEG24641.1 Mov34/MPN/PAD-1 family protein [Mariniblastus fucicola]
MSSEIQFGDVEQNEPQKAVRPDRDAHYCIAAVGEIDPDNLPIYVDLDVMRDMEAHAHTNTNVELGGVMLGKQCIDADGKPFVVVTDSLRARHYEATRGSFKFTHETWSQITGERNQFHPELEMVGWYHTHPGWTVFLSPMDLFICNNFFNRTLDVALVIDPCNDDRGWFQWDDSHQTQRTGGFYLTSIRYREDELNHFASLYNHEPPMNADPRYSGYSIPGSTTQGAAMDTRKPWFDLLMVSMLLTQLFFMGFMVMKLGGAGESATPADIDAAAVAEDDPLLENRSLKMALSTLANAQGKDQLAEQMLEMETDRQQLAAGLDGQMARVELLQQERERLIAEYDVRDRQVHELSEQVTSLQSTISTMAEKAEDASAEGESDESTTFGWGALVGTALVSLLLGGGGMFLVRRETDDDVAVEQEASEMKFEAVSSDTGG